MAAAELVSCAQVSLLKSFPSKYAKARAEPMRLVSSVQPQLGNVLWIGLQFAFLDALDNIDQHRIGAAGKSYLLSLTHDEAVQKFDLGAAAFLHVLAHRRTLSGGGVGGILEALRVARLLRHRIAFAGACDGFRRQMQDVLELIAMGLADADRLGAEAGR